MTDRETNLLFFKKYQDLGGSIQDLAEYEKHLNVFFARTMRSYVFGEGPTREKAFASWEKYCRSVNLSEDEPGLFFQSVDLVHAYT